ncbi:hypothetical protein ACIGG9_24840 [Pseudonocardia alni]|uniref:hypothetical protein n=1 Tax=Pseudonocardia alni TaxID=33907 RepID=UPI00340481DF
MLGALKDAFVTLAPSLPGLAEAFSNIATALSPLVGWIADALKWLIDNALIPFGRWAKDNPGSV